MQTNHKAQEEVKNVVEDVGHVVAFTYVDRVEKPTPVSRRIR
jgi:hypothetical protein